MSSQQLDSTVQVHQMARLSYLADLMMNRRVLIIGNDFELAQFVSDSRARHVISVAERQSDIPWPERSSTPGIEFQSMDLASLKFRDGSFDMAVLPDLTALHDSSAILGEIQRIIGHQGQAMIGAPNPTCALRLGAKPGSYTIDYYEMYDVLSEVFPNVQMIGQSPFVGYTVADLAAGDSEQDIRFDGSLLGGETEEIEWFLAVCGENLSDLSPYSIIQIPFSEVSVGQADAGQQGRVEQLESETGQLQKSLEEAKLELSTRGVRIQSLQKDLENELLQSEAARARAVQVSKELDEERKASQKKSIEEQYSKRSQDMELQASVKDLSIQLKQAEERAIAAEDSRDNIVDRMRADAAELERLRDRLSMIGEESEESLAEKKSLKAEIQDLKAKLNALSIQLKQAEERASTAEASRDNIVDRMRADAAELDHLRNKIDAIEETSQKSSAEKRSLEAEIQDLKTALKDATEKAAVDKSKESNLEAFEEETKRNLEILAAEIGDLEKRLEEKAVALKTAKHEIERHEAISRDLIVALEGKDTATSVPGDDLATLQEALQRTTAELDSARSLIEAKEKSLQESAADLAAATDSLQSSESKIAELEEALSDSQKEMDGLAKESGESEKDPNDILEQNQKMAELEAALQSARWRTAEMEARNQDMERLVEEKDFKLRSLEQEIDSLGQKTSAEEPDLSRNQALEASERNARMFEEEAIQQTERATYLQQSLDEARDRVSGLEQQLAEAAESQNRFESELGNMAKRSEETERLVREAEDRSVKTFEQLEETTARLEAASAELDGSHAQIVSLQAAVQEAETTVRQELAEELEEANRLSVQVSELEGRLKNTEDNLSEERNRSEKLLSTIETLRVEKDGETDRTKQADADATKMAEETNALRLQLEERVKEAAERTEEIKTLEEVLKNLREEMSDIWTKNEQVQTAWNDDREKTAALSKEIDRLNSAQEAAQNLENEFEDAKSKADRLEKDLDDSRQRIAALETELGETATRAENLESGLEEAKRQADLLKNELGDTSQTTVDIERERDEAKAQATALIDEMDAAKQRVHSLESELDGITLSAAGHEEQLAAVTEEKVALNQQMEESDALRAKLESTVEESNQLVENVRRELDQAKVRITEFEAEAVASAQDADVVTQLKDQLQAAQEKLQDAQEKATESAEQGTDVSTLQETNTEQEKLLESLTSQLEEREQRANRLQRQVRELGIQIKEHESDIVAWEMELKFRNTRISQLETENEKIQKELAAKPKKTSHSPPPVPQSIEGAVSAAALSPADNPDALRTKVGQLNEALGDKDAELLILHSQIEDSKRRMDYTRNILEEIIRQNKVDSQTAQQFSDLVQAMK